ncbi:hypothetical protein V6N11_043387 [Hibiscus sabdariffa]|uniref:ubiquitinyl hydrolase 1 n=1 Tax=Hibiscus sabdariffa TaxID=183260 RepID=A0ABR2RC11_9ROSI
MKEKSSVIKGNAAFVTARDEAFLDLSLDIEQNSSITSCLKNFSSTETLNAEDKFFCDKCCSLQEAQKRMKIKKPPHILVIHLKRFKYIEQLGRYKKLSYRVVFPVELKLSNTVEDADSEYSLFAVVVHVGSGPNHGHYVSLVKSHNHWLFFDDENVEMIDESAVQTFFGVSILPWVQVVFMYSGWWKEARCPFCVGFSTIRGTKNSVQMLW